MAEFSGFLVTYDYCASAILYIIKIIQLFYLLLFFPVIKFYQILS